MMFRINTTVQACELYDSTYAGELGSIIIDYTYNDNPLDDVDFKVYKIASSVNDEYDMTEKFVGFEIDFDALTSESYWISVRNNLENYIACKNIEQDMEFVTDCYGKYKIEDLEPGMYYIDAENVVEGNQEFFSEPILIMVGYYYPSDDMWLYHFTVEPKIDMMSYTGTYDITVMKTWEDVPSESLIPEYIEVELYCDGEVYDTVRLTEENGWTYSWYDIDESKEWGVLETTTLQDFEVEYNHTFFTFEIINTYVGDPVEEPEEEPEDPSEDPDKEETLPQTGTSANQIPITAGIGLVLITVGGVLNRRGREDEA